MSVQECDFIGVPRMFGTVGPVSAPLVTFQEFHQFASCRFRFFRHVVRLGTTFGVLGLLARRTLNVEQMSPVIDFIFPLVIRTEKSRRTRTSHREKLTTIIIDISILSDVLPVRADIVALAGGMRGGTVIAVAEIRFEMFAADVVLVHRFG